MTDDGNADFERWASEVIDHVRRRGVRDGIPPEMLALILHKLHVVMRLSMTNALGGSMHGIYILDDDGNPTPARELGQYHDSFLDPRRFVAVDIAEDGAYISTIFTGIDYAFGQGKPLLFETMIRGGPYDGWQKRYHTREESVAGHHVAVVLAGGKVAEMIDSKWQRGDFVEIQYRCQSMRAMVLLASGNDRSLMLGFDGIMGKHAGSMPLLQDADGVYRSLIDDEPVTIRAVEH